MRLRALVLIALAACACSEAPAPPAARDAAATAAVKPHGVRVTSVSGAAELKRAAAPPRRLQVGDELGAEDSVRTDDGTAGFDVGGVAEVQVAPHTQVAVAELTAKLKRVRLRDGRLSAVVHGTGDDGFEVEAQEGAAVARALKGEFSVQALGAHVAVAAKAGEVTLAAHGRSVQIGAGQISVVEAQQPPSAPSQIPPSLYVKLTSSHPAAQRARDTLVKGATAPGAVISVGGVRAVADAAGTFSAHVALREGANDLVIESEDALGRRQKAQVPRIVVDSSEPDVKSKVKW
jgi:hypothetical protein